MPRKRRKPEEIVAKLQQVDVLVSHGKSVADAVRAISVTEVTYYRWRQEFGGLKSDQVNRMTRRAASANDLEAENARLRRAVSDLTLDKMILAEGGKGKLVSPARCRAFIDHVRSELTLSERRVAVFSDSIARHSADVPRGRMTSKRSSMI